MRELGGFSREAEPVFANFGRAAPSLAVASRQLAPFATATNISLRSLGDAGEEAGPLLVEADPTIVNLRDLARSGSRPLKNLGLLAKSVRRTKGFEHLMRFIYNNVGWSNGFDQFGHLLRENFLTTNCIDYSTIPTAECKANWADEEASNSVARMPSLGELNRLLALEPEKREPDAARHRERGDETEQIGGPETGDEPSGAEANARDVLEYLLGQ
jgi:hypothetical protein